MKHKQIEIIARGALLHDDRLLLCRNRSDGHTFLPGGHVDFGEQARAALAREMREELGVDLVATRFLGAMEACFVQPKARPPDRSDDNAPPRDATPAGRHHHEINLVFALSPAPGHDSPDHASLRSQEPHIEFIWLTLSELLSDPPAATVLPAGIIKLIRATAPTATAPSEQMWHTAWK